MKIELWDKKIPNKLQNRDFHGETQRDRSYVFLMKAFEIDIGNVWCMIWRTIIEHELQIILVKLRNPLPTSKWFCKYYCNIDRIHATGSMSTRRFSCYQELLNSCSATYCNLIFSQDYTQHFNCNQIKLISFFCSVLRSYINSSKKTDLLGLTCKQILYA